MKIARALLSVSDKRGIVDFARALRALGVEILSTGGTARLLAEQGVEVVQVSDYTGFPELMGGRLKTLHPRIHGGLLGRRGRDDDAMAAHGIAPIDLAAVNLYPFEQTLADPQVGRDAAVEQIDIGGPALLRAAAKNHAAAAALVDCDDYAAVIDELRRNGGALCDATRLRLAAKAFAHTARYDAAIADWLRSVDGDAGDAGELPTTLDLRFSRRETMRYGENPHQQGALYVDPAPVVPSVAVARQLHGKPLSYNNVADADAALECLLAFPERPACVVVKHAIPCGAAVADTLESAWRRARSADPVSAFGGVVALNRPLDGATARALAEHFIEVIVAPTIAEEARALFAANQRGAVRLLACGEMPTERAAMHKPRFDFKRIRGGLLAQTPDEGVVADDALRVVTRRAPTAREREDLLFAWRVCKFVKSNAIVYARQGCTAAISGGQTSRVEAVRSAARKAADLSIDLCGAAVASDGFFPFRDGLDALHAAGATAVIQPGGSRRDAETIAAADQHGIAMLFTGMRHFRH